jgi:hypothetical protein
MKPLDPLERKHLIWTSLKILDWITRSHQDPRLTATRDHILVDLQGLDKTNLLELELFEIPSPPDHEASIKGLLTG